MRLKYALPAITLSVASLYLSGCSNIQLSGTKTSTQEIKSYNSLVLKTIANYARSKVFAEQNSVSVLSYLVSNKNSTVINSNVTGAKPILSREDMNAFKGYTLAMDQYFTSLGNSGVQEIIVLDGKNKIMYANINWGKNKIYYMSRVVINS